MAYNRENLLRRIIDVLNVVSEHKEHDTPYTKIYRKHIKDRFHISYSTFNEWISMSPSPGAQLKELLAKKEKQKEIEKLQLNLFED